MGSIHLKPLAGFLLSAVSHSRSPGWCKADDRQPMQCIQWLLTFLFSEARAPSHHETTLAWTRFVLTQVSVPSISPTPPMAWMGYHWDIMTIRWVPYTPQKSRHEKYFLRYHVQLRGVIWRYNLSNPSNSREKAWVDCSNVKEWCCFVKCSLVSAC